MNSYTDRSYPLFKRNLKLEEFYKKIEEKNNRSIFRQRISKKALIWFFALVLFFVSTPIAIDQLTKIQELRTQAQQEPTSLIVQTENGIVSGGAFQDTDFLTGGGSFVDLGSNSYPDLDIANCAPIPSGLGRIEIPVDVGTLGTYFYWSRISSPVFTYNSYYAQFDSECPVLIGGSPLPLNSWVWINTRSTQGGNRIIVDLTAGRHTLVIAAVNPYVKIDQILLTTDAKCIPVLKGLNCLQSTTVK